MNIFIFFFDKILNIYRLEFYKNVNDQKPKTKKKRRRETGPNAVARLQIVFGFVRAAEENAFAKPTDTQDTE